MNNSKGAGAKKIRFDRRRHERATSGRIRARGRVEEKQRANAFYFLPFSLTLSFGPER